MGEVGNTKPKLHFILLETKALDNVCMGNIFSYLKVVRLKMLPAYPASLG